MQLVVFLPCLQEEDTISSINIIIRYSLISSSEKKCDNDMKNNLCF